MLVLSRQRDETIMIGDDIEVTVVDIRGDKVRLGIKAPKEVSVHRQEVYDSIKRDQLSNANVAEASRPTVVEANVHLMRKGEIYRCPAPCNGEVFARLSNGNHQCNTCGKLFTPSEAITERP